MGTPIGIWMPAVRVAASGTRADPLGNVGAKPLTPAATSSSDAIFVRMPLLSALSLRGRGQEDARKITRRTYDDLS